MLKNGLTNWDDTDYISNNYLIRSLSFPSIQRIFATSVLDIYSPLSILSLAIEYHFFGASPFVYHFNNLLLHLLVVWLIYLFSLRLGLSQLSSMVATFIFALHPMHVESVAWVSERKDVLYASFYMLALIQYLHYLENGKRGHHNWAIFFCLLSMLAKPMAVSLPFVLCILDWFRGRKITFNHFLEKWPYFFIVGGLICVTYFRNQLAFKVSNGISFLTWIWSFNFYIKKFFVPISFNPVYTQPQPVVISNIFYIKELVLWLSCLGVVWVFRKNKWIVFAFLFYLASIFFLLRLEPHLVKNMVADRFMYLPSLGICLGLGVGVGHALNYFKENGHLNYQLSSILLGLLFLVLSYKTHEQTKVWRDSMTLWDYSVHDSPQALNYVNRANTYIEKNQYPLALADAEQAMRFDPFYANAYNTLGSIYQRSGPLEKALGYFNRAIALNEKEGMAYNNRGLYYLMQSQNDLALQDFSKSIAVNKDDYAAYSYRALVYLRENNLEKAFEDVNKSMSINVYYSPAYLNRASIYILRGDLASALADLDKAIELDPKSFEAYSNRCYVYYKTNKLALALSDCNQALIIEPGFVGALHNRELVDKAMEDEKKSSSE